MALQTGSTSRVLHGYIVLAGNIRCETGMHIGGVAETIEIGGIDKPIIRNPLDGYPYIPGSSLKGKMRSIVEKCVSREGTPLVANRHGGDKEKKVWRHECDDYERAKDCPLCRMFGATAFGAAGQDTAQNNYPSMLLVRDGSLSNANVLAQDGMPVIEAKMENAIDRLTSAAHPRTFERVPAGAEFNFEMIYRIESLRTTAGGDIHQDNGRAKDDIDNLLRAMEILEKDGLGGSISRGYGKITFLVKEFQGYDINNNMQGGFKVAQDQAAMTVTACKGKVNEIQFTKTKEK